MSRWKIEFIPKTHRNEPNAKPWYVVEIHSGFVNAVRGRFATKAEAEKFKLQSETSA